MSKPDTHNLAEGGAQSQPAPGTPGQSPTPGASAPPSAVPSSRISTESTRFLKDTLSPSAMDTGPLSESDAEPMPIEVRNMVEEDKAFIFATWLRSYGGSSWFARKIPRNIFFDFHHKVIERIFARNATVLIATPVGDPGTILGYLVHEGPVLHFIYTKGPFRKLGVATELIEASGLDPDHSLFTHLTFDADHLLKKHPGARYNPYMI